jgi:choline dehydrogenase-like flavoprotein
VTVYLSSNVVALEDVDDAGRVHTAVVRTVAVREWRVRATTFVLAAGGIENPRILLASCDARPQGLGNENDLVGRYFMEHLHVRLGCFVPTRAVTNLSLYTEGRRSVRRPVGALCVAPAEREARRLFGLSATLIRPQHRSVPEVLAHQARGRAPWTLHGMSIARGGALGFGLRVVDKVIRTMINARGVSPSNNPNAPPPVYEVMARGEQTPLRDSRVTILTERDRLGMPMPQLDWRVNPADLQSLRRNLETMGEGLAAAGAGTLYLPDDPETAWAQRIMGSWRHIGTTRMHTDPRRGVVDAEGRVHSSPNVFVTGSSVFPTGGFANPTLTIIALALRLSDQVIRDLRGQALRATVTH